MFSKMRKHLVTNISLLFYISVVISEFLQKVEQHCKCVLCNTFCRIAGYIAPCDAAGVKIVFIKIICPCGSDADKFQMSGSSDRLFIDSNFIQNDNICTPRHDPGLLLGKKSHM